MNLNTGEILNQIDDALDRWNKIRSRSKYQDCSDLPRHEVMQTQTTLLTTLERLAPRGTHYGGAARTLGQRCQDGLHGRSLAEAAGILSALRADYEAGYLQSVSELVHADVFTDMLDMASHFLEHEFKDPAAVIVGSVLEEQLRKLMNKNGLALTGSNSKPKKADSMNAELANNGTSSVLDQKNITAWLELRNKAAHGHYPEYTKLQVDVMLRGVREFIERNPA